MCNNVIKTDEGLTFACRSCDECISARRFDWVSRAMAERATSRFALSVTLTYGNETQFQRDGAAAFRYSDIQKFLKQFRNQALRVHNCEHAVSYICAGEQGERNGRCHWHIVIFSDIDPVLIGDFTRPSGLVTDRSQMVTNMTQKAIRLNWSIWPHGFVALQEADEGGMHYAISYALKDQFSGDKANGHKRQAKSETFATGLFRMSKKPPIGWQFLSELLHSLGQSGQVLPKPHVKVPDLSGYWYPRGAMRRYLLTGLYNINQKVREERGRDAPQWSSLLAFCQNSDKDMEILNGQAEQETFEDIAREINARVAFAAREKQLRQTRRRCGSTLPCSNCLLHHSTGFAFRDLAIERYETPHGEIFRYQENDLKGNRLADHQSDGACKGVNSLCYLKDSQTVREAFPYSVGRKYKGC